MSFIHQANINNTTYDIIGSCYFGTCSTAAATAAKAVTISNASGFNLVPGVTAAIKFTNANSAASPTLNINSAGAKKIKYRNAAIASSSYYWTAGQVVTFIYDGEAWQTTDYLKPISDTKVIQTDITSANKTGEYPIILKYATGSGNITNTTNFTSKVSVEPSLGRIKANNLALYDEYTDLYPELWANNNHLYLTPGVPDGELAIAMPITVGFGGSNIKPIYVDENGEISEVDYTLGAACEKDISDSTSASAISTGTNLVTERDIYYGLPKINNSHTYTSSTNIYAPTTAGTSGYVLKSNGSGAPSWVDGASLIAPQKITLVATAGQTSFSIPFEYDSLSSNLTVYFNGILMKETDNYIVNTTNNTVTLVDFSAETGDIITIMGLLGAQSIDFGQEAIDAINEINIAVAAAKIEINNTVDDAKTEINSAAQEAINNINNLKSSLPPNWEGFITKSSANVMGDGGRITMDDDYTPVDNYDVTTKTYVDSAISTATSNIVTDVFYMGDSEDNTKQKLLWIDTSSENGNGIIKYYNGSTWIAISSPYT